MRGLSLLLQCCRLQKREKDEVEEWGLWGRGRRASGRRGGKKRNCVFLEGGGGGGFEGCRELVVVVLACVCVWGGCHQRVMKTIRHHSVPPSCLWLHTHTCMRTLTPQSGPREWKVFVSCTDRLLLSTPPPRLLLLSALTHSFVSVF